MTITATATATPTHDLEPLRPRPKRRLRLAGGAVWIAAAAVLVALWPASLGGSTAYIMVSGTSMEPTMHTGDLAVMRARPGYEAGDVVAYRIPKGTTGAGFMVIHRVIGGSATEGYILQGDNRTNPDVWRPRHDDVVGAQVALVPRAGRVLGAVANPLGVATFLAALTVVLIVTLPPRDHEP